MKLLLLIRQLNVGGSERQVVNLAHAFAHANVDVQVAAFYPGGELVTELRETAALHYHSLDKHGRNDNIAFALKLRAHLQRERFDAIYSFLHGPNLASLLARATSDRPAIIWGIRSTTVNFSLYPKLYRFAEWTQDRLAFLADRVIVNSASGRAACLRRGYPQRKLHVVPNGIDTATFAPRPDAREEIRRRLAIPDDAPLIGLFARIDRMKNQRLFIEAASRTHESSPRAHFLIAGSAGPGMERYSTEVQRFANEAGLASNVHWVGQQADVPAWMSACDLTTLTSNDGEGFPNVVAESMACGVPCVSTNVGEAPEIVGDIGSIVPPGDAKALSHAWNTYIAKPHAEREAKGHAARARIETRYALPAVATATLDVIESAVRERRT